MHLKISKIPNKIKTKIDLNLLRFSNMSNINSLINLNLIYKRKNKAKKKKFK